MVFSESKNTLILSICCCLALLLTAPSETHAKSTEVEKLLGLRAKVLKSYDAYSKCMGEVQEIISETTDPLEFPDTRDRELICYRKFFKQMAQVKKGLEKTHARIKKHSKTNPNKALQKKLEHGFTEVAVDYKTAIRNVERFRISFVKKKELYLAQLEQRIKDKREKKKHPLELDIEQ